jgi:hypothetical protein
MRLKIRKKLFIILRTRKCASNICQVYLYMYYIQYTILILYYDERRNQKNRRFVSKKSKKTE